MYVHPKEFTKLGPRNYYRNLVQPCLQTLSLLAITTGQLPYSAIFFASPRAHKPVWCGIAGAKSPHGGATSTVTQAVLCQTIRGQRGRVFITWAYPTPHTLAQVSSPTYHHPAIIRQRSPPRYHHPNCNCSKVSNF